MRIILFTENQRFGGMDTFIVNLIDHWPDKKDSFLLICNHSHPGLDKLNKILEIETVKHKIPLNWSFLSTIINYLPNILKRFIRQLFKLLLMPLQYYLIKDLFKNNNADALISINGAYPGGETCRIANIVWSKLGRKNSIHNIHNYTIQSRPIIRPLENMIDRTLSNSVDAIVSVSNNCADSLKIRGNINQNKVQVIRNGIKSMDLEISANSLRNILKIPLDHKIITMIGSYEERKGHEFLFRSMRKVYEKYENITLVIIGTGNTHEISKINKLAENYLKSKSVHLIGELDNAASYLKDADLLVIPSQSDESFGLTAIEAMQNSTAIVSTNVGGLPETIGENGQCGFCVDKHNETEFADRIIFLMINDVECKRLGINGYNRAKKLFSPDEMSRNYHELLKQR